ncbi:MAG: peroxidase, partial [Modestobacter sp.]|nr:peroxidase [Modestobacter sp.]
MTEGASRDPRPAGLSRRRFFGLAGAGTAGVIAAGAAGGVIGRATAE